MERTVALTLAGEAAGDCDLIAAIGQRASGVGVAVRVLRLPVELPRAVTIAKTAGARILLFRETDVRRG